MRQGGEELLLHRAQSLELVGEVGGTGRFVLDELVDQTVGDAGEGGLALLELILVLEVIGGGQGDSDDLVGVSVGLGAKLLQLEVVVIVVHLRLLSDFDGILRLREKRREDKQRLHLGKLLLQKSQDLFIDTFYLGSARIIFPTAFSRGSSAQPLTIAL